MGFLFVGLLFWLGGLALLWPWLPLYSEPMRYWPTDKNYTFWGLTPTPGVVAFYLQKDTSEFPENTLLLWDYHHGRMVHVLRGAGDFGANQNGVLQGHLVGARGEWLTLCRRETAPDGGKQFVGEVLQTTTLKVLFSRVFVPAPGWWRPRLTEDGQFIVFGERDENPGTLLSCFDVASNKQLGTQRINTRWGLPIPNGPLFALNDASIKGIQILELPSLRRLCSLVAPADAKDKLINMRDFSHDSQHLLDNQFQLWKIPEGTLVGQMSVNYSGSEQVLFDMQRPQLLARIHTADEQSYVALDRDSLQEVPSSRIVLQSGGCSFISLEPSRRWPHYVKSGRCPDHFNNPNLMTKALDWLSRNTGFNFYGYSGNSCATDIIDTRTHEVVMTVGSGSVHILGDTEPEGVVVSEAGKSARFYSFPARKDWRWVAGFALIWGTVLCVVLRWFRRRLQRWLLTPAPTPS
ncbi:MAG: hypothetical protein ACRCZF_10895 [Gemmataceae bacterium]